MKKMITCICGTVLVDVSILKFRTEYKIPVLFLLLLMPRIAPAQMFKWLKVENDTAYITDLTSKLTVRAFGANKLAQYAPGDNDYLKKLTYTANDDYNIGLGFNYKYIGINGSFKMPFVNNDTVRFGKTKSFELQTFIYMRKFTVDLFFLSYNGHYLSNRSILNTPSNSNIYPQRPDLRTRNIGMNTQYIFNNRRFSFRAAFLQNEYQKKSAGSVIAGAALNYIKVKADSAIVPTNIGYDGYFGNNTFTGSNVLSLGLNAGYAHTFVIKKNFFITASLMGGAGVNYTKLSDKVKNLDYNSLGLQLNSIARLAAGYNTTDYFAGIQYINFTNRCNAPVPGTWQEFQTDNIRLTVAKRFKLKRAMQKKINKIENDIKSELGIPEGVK